MTKEDIINKLSSNADRIYNLFSGDEDMDDNKIGNQAYRLGCDHALALLDQYAKERAVEFLDWVNTNAVKTKDGYYHDQLREYYNRAELYQIFTQQNHRIQ